VGMCLRSSLLSTTGDVEARDMPRSVGQHGLTRRVLASSSCRPYVARGTQCGATLGDSPHAASASVDQQLAAARRTLAQLESAPAFPVMSTASMASLVAFFLATSCVLSFAVGVAGSAVATAVDWSHLNATSMSQVDPVDFLTLTAAQFRTVPIDACAGIQLAQLRNLGASTANESINACKGMPPYCMVSLSAVAISGLQASCLRSVAPERFDVNSNAIRAFPAALVADVSPAQFQNLGLDSIGYLSATQIAQLPQDVCASMGVFALNQLEDGTRAAQVPPQCSGFTTACVQALSPDALTAIHGSCLKDMGVEALNSMSSAEVTALPADQLSWLPPTLAAGLDARFCGALSGINLDWMGSPRSPMPLLGFTSQCWAAINATACLQTDGNWLQLFESPSNASRLASLSTQCVSSFRCGVWNGLQSEAMSSVRASLDPAGSAALTSRCEWNPPHGPSGDNHLPRGVWIGLTIGGTIALVVAVAAAIVYAQKRNRWCETDVISQRPVGAYAAMV